MLALAEGIKLATADGVDWILHIDTDELVYPGGSADYSLQTLLLSQPGEVDMIVFPNYESMPESAAVVKPFEEVNGLAIHCMGFWEIFKETSSFHEVMFGFPSCLPAYEYKLLTSAETNTLPASVVITYKMLVDVQVTLFKRNFHHVDSDAYFKHYRTVSKGNPNYFITYGNGKSAARIQPGLRPNGAHRWYSYYKAPR